MNKDDEYVIIDDNEESTFDFQIIKNFMSEKNIIINYFHNLYHPIFDNSNTDLIALQETFQNIGEQIVNNSDNDNDNDNENNKIINELVNDLVNDIINNHQIGKIPPLINKNNKLIILEKKMNDFKYFSLFGIVFMGFFYYFKLKPFSRPS